MESGDPDEGLALALKGEYFIGQKFIEQLRTSWPETTGYEASFIVTALPFFFQPNRTLGELQATYQHHLALLRGPCPAVLPAAVHPSDPFTALKMLRFNGVGRTLVEQLTFFSNLQEKRCRLEAERTTVKELLR